MSAESFPYFPEPEPLSYLPLGGRTAFEVQRDERMRRLSRQITAATHEVQPRHVLSQAAVSKLGETATVLADGFADETMGIFQEVVGAEVISPETRMATRLAAMARAQQGELALAA